MEYTPHHQIIMRVEADDPANIIARLKAEKLLVFPIGDVAQIKACDFCNLEKDEAIPVAEELNRVIGGLKAPKEFKVGLNGCGMACYGAVLEDVGIVYRRGAFDLFLGGKTTGRNAHAAQPVAEGISAEDIVPVIERVFRNMRSRGIRMNVHKFFKRVGIVAGFEHQDSSYPPLLLMPYAEIDRGNRNGSDIARWAWQPGSGRKCRAAAFRGYGAQ